MLNYAYAILRASMARSVSASGLLPVFGIWHQNRYNSFNLVDDLIEPFRAICDLHVKRVFSKYSNLGYMDVTIKRELVALLGFDCVEIGGGITSLSKSVELFLISYKKAMFADDSQLVLYPTINREFFKDECF